MPEKNTIITVEVGIQLNKPLSVAMYGLGSNLDVWESRLLTQKRCSMDKLEQEDYQKLHHAVQIANSCGGVLASITFVPESKDTPLSIKFAFRFDTTENLEKFDELYRN